MKNGVMPKASQVKASDFKLDELLKDIKTKNPKCSRCGL
jgi:ribosomal protein S27AE